MPSASFGVGGEFGVGGKYDNGQRFDLRLPFVDQGWVDESSTLTRKSYAKKPKGAKSGERAGSPQPKPKREQRQGSRGNRKKPPTVEGRNVGSRS